MITSNTKITILAENYAMHTPHAEDGISILISTGLANTTDKKYFLFDTGFSGECAIKNMQIMQIEVPKLSGIILSHGHNDHTGGIVAITSKFGPCPIYTSEKIFNRTFSVNGKNREYIGIPFERNYLEKDLKIPFKFSNTLTKIDENIYMTGIIPMNNRFEKIPSHFKIETKDGFISDTFEDDNAMIISDHNGLIVLLGCAHRGVVNTLEYIKNSFPDKKIHTVIGGTHLKEANEEHFEFVIDYLKGLNLTLLAPGHCTGISNIFKLQNIFGSIVRPAFCGEKYKI